MTPGQAATVIQKAVKAAVGSGLKKAGSMAGAHAGAMIGMPKKGAKFGSGVAARLSRLIGTGDYTTNEGMVSANSLFGKSSSSANAGSFESAKGGVRLKHREYMQDIFAPSSVGSTFTVSQFVVNPGLSYVFPYLAQIAANFEQYRFHGLVFEFISTTAPYGVTALGSYVMAMEYNAAAPLFTTKPQMENSDYALSCRLDHSGMYGIECAPGSQAQNYYYVRSPGATIVQNLTDTGIMQIGLATTTVAAGTAGITVNSAIGELWVTYDVELIRPRISPARYGYIHMRASGTTNAAPLGVTQATTAYGALTGPVFTGTSISFPNASIGDTYQVTFNWAGAATNGLAYPTFTLANMIANNLITSTAGVQNAGNLGGTTPVLLAGAALVENIYVTITGEQPVVPSITLAATVVPAGYLDVFVYDLGNGYAAGTI